jgi:hypothetical protein
MRSRIALTAATVVSALVIASGANADPGNGNGHGHGHGHGNAGINGQYAFTGESQCLWVSTTAGNSFNASGQPVGASFTTTNTILGTLTIGGNVSADIVLINPTAGLGTAGGADLATLSGSAGTITNNTLTLDNLTGKFTGGALNGDTFKINKIVLAGSDSQDHKTLVLAGDASSFNVETVQLTNSTTGSTLFDRICQYSIVAVRTGSGSGSDN